MRPKEAWGRMQSPTKETGLGQPKDVFSRKQTGYSMWTEAMKAAIGQLRRAGRKWYALYVGESTSPFLRWRLKSGEPYAGKPPVRFGGRGE